MPHFLPTNFPPEVVAGGKTFKLILPVDSVRLGICQKNDGRWFYYATGKDDTPGGRRHLSICAGPAMKGGKRKNGSIHISLKPKLGRHKQGFYYFYYADAESGTAERFVKAGDWGVGGSYEKAERILNEFLVRFTELTSANTKPVVKAVMAAATSLPNSDEEIEEDLHPVSTSPEANPFEGREVPDSWDDI